MFNNLLNFSYTRNLREAFGFYIAYLILTMLLGGLLGGATAVLFNIEEAEAFDIGAKVGNISAVIIAISLSFAILKAKSLLSKFGYLLLAIIAGILALLLGGLGGLIPVAYLTTR